MLAVLLLAAVLNEAPASVSPAAVRTSCPSLPVEIVAPTARICDVLEVTGHIDPSGVALDPAFDTRAPELEMARPVPGTASLAAYDKNGNTIFTFPFSATGAFKLVLPLGTKFATSVARMTLTASGATIERVPVATEEPGAEAVEADENHLVFAWNAREYPGLRISAADNTPIANVIGTQTYEQIYVKSKAQRLFVSFSNGVRSFMRTVEVFGRR